MTSLEHLRSSQMDALGMAYEWHSQLAQRLVLQSTPMGLAAQGLRAQLVLRERLADPNFFFSDISRYEQMPLSMIGSEVAVSGLMGLGLYHPEALPPEDMDPSEVIERLLELVGEDLRLTESPLPVEPYISECSRMLVLACEIAAREPQLEAEHAADAYTGSMFQVAVCAIQAVAGLIEQGLD